MGLLQGKSDVFNRGSSGDDTQSKLLYSASVTHSCFFSPDENEPGGC